MRHTLAKEGGQITRFAVVGGVCVLTYYSLFIGLTELFGVWYVVSAIVAFVVYFLVQFTLQKFWAFKDKEKKYIKRQLTQFTVTAVANWIVNTGLLYVLVEYLHVWYVLAQTVLTIIMSVLAYFVYRWIFRAHQPPPL